MENNGILLVTTTKDRMFIFREEDKHKIVPYVESIGEGIYEVYKHDSGVEVSLEINISSWEIDNKKLEPIDITDEFPKYTFNGKRV